VEKKRKTIFGRLWKPFADIFGVNRWIAVAAVVGAAGILVLAVFLFFYLAPPKSITITTGPEGSAFQTNAMKYRKILMRNAGVELKIVPSGGSAENLERLNDPKSAVDVGFVQGGISNETTSGNVVSLGSLYYEPMLVFYCGTGTVSSLSDFKGKRLAIGSPGSGTRALALALLKLHKMEPGGNTEMVDSGAEESVKALLEDKVEAAFLTSDSASPRLMRQLLLNEEVHLVNFTHADAYARRVSYLNRLDLPMGALDFGQNIPKENIRLVGPTVELLARKDLRPTLIDLLLDAAQEVHGGAGLFRKKGEFPSLVAHEFPVSEEAVRYQKSGKSFLYRKLPFWMASTVNRVLLVFVPLVVLLIPGLRMIPSVLGWKTKLRLYRWYRALLSLEYEMRGEVTPGKRQELLARLNAIEEAVNGSKIPASYGDQFYGLRFYIDFVKERLAREA
jgi:TRAP transporter TAXI family solute receptor